MIVFYDTCVHVDVLRGEEEPDSVLSVVGGGPLRMSPVVASELLRGARGASVKAVEKLVSKLLPIEPPAWRKAWHEAGRALPAVFAHHEEVGLARLQNDILLAITARYTGATFVTRDAHFVTIAERIPFLLVRL